MSFFNLSPVCEGAVDYLVANVSLQLAVAVARISMDQLEWYFFMLFFVDDVI